MSETGPGFHPGRPTTARVYNYAAGGKDNYAADRELAGEITGLAPGAGQIAEQNRAFIRRALRHAASQGVCQFADIGAGIPLLAESTHDIALEYHPAARCVYVDRDPHVVNHLRGQAEMPPQVVALHGNLADPGRIMASPVFAGCIDLARPVAVVLGAVLHFLPGQGAYTAVEHVKRGLVPGSYLIISHATADGTSQDVARAVQARYAERLDPLTFRTRPEVTRFFDGWELVPPGVVDVGDWQHDGEAGAFTALYGGVAVKRPPRRAHADFLV
ncbi:MAG: SAM-dependent methyltransferase [Trebonia sp.]